MAVQAYTNNTQISTHFNSSEFKCKCGCGVSKIDTDLVNMVENIFSKVNASKCIVTSGYRCPTSDKKANGFAGRHSEGLAMDTNFYDKDGKIIPSVIIVCVAWLLKELKGIAYITSTATHLDNRANGTYYGDEPKGNSSYWSDPFAYFNVTMADVEKYTGKWETEVPEETKPTPSENEKASDIFKINDKVLPITLVNWEGKKLVQHDKEYYITKIEDDRNTVVLSALRNGKYEVWARFNYKNVMKA